MSEPSPLTAARHAARARYRGGDPVGAAALLDDALQRCAPAYGEDHPQVLAAAHELARMHRGLGRSAQARRVLEEALAAGQRRWGDADPMILTMSYDLGAVADELGNRHEARRNFGRVATAGPAVLGQDHWAVRAARDYLGRDPTVPAARPVPPPARPSAGPVRSAPPRPPAGAPAAEVPAGRRRPGLAVVGGAVAAVAVLAAAVLVAAVLAAVAVFGGGDRPPARIVAPPTANTPAVSVTAEPPGDVRVRRDGDALVLTWTDPAPGRASFVVTGGQRGQAMRFVGQVPAGAPPRLPVHGFNPTLDYCFQVAAVYSTTELGVAQPVCSENAGSSPDR